MLPASACSTGSPSASPPPEFIPYDWIDNNNNNVQVCQPMLGTYWAFSNLVLNAVGPLYTLQKP